MQQTKKPSSGAIMPPQSGNEHGEEATAASPKAESLVASNDQSVEKMDQAVPVEEEHKYLTGLELFAAMISITLVGFLFLLDTSIVSTVSWRSLFAKSWDQSCS